jgi:hypothetical protein
MTRRSARSAGDSADAAIRSPSGDASGSADAGASSDAGALRAPAAARSVAGVREAARLRADGVPRAAMRCAASAAARALSPPG